LFIPALNVDRPRSVTKDLAAVTTLAMHRGISLPRAVGQPGIAMPIPLESSVMVAARLSDNDETASVATTASSSRDEATCLPWSVKPGAVDETAMVLTNPSSGESPEDLSQARPAGLRRL
jgi:hypothetical protein